MNLFARIIRDIRESKEGRIRRLPGHWKLVPDEMRADGRYLIPGKEDEALWHKNHERISTDKRGRKMQLVGTRAVHCPNPEYADQFASLRENTVCLSVPESFCKQCAYYRTARKSHRKYATCGYKSVENPEVATAEEFLGLLSRATKKANELIG